jgi:hypothetical protein
MPKIFRSSVISAPIYEVWVRIRDFNALPDWHPAFTDSHIENDEPGDKERLLSLSDVRRLCTLPGDAGKLLLHYCQHTAMRPGIRGSKHFLADLPRICIDKLKSRPHKFHQQRIVMIVGCF